MGTSRISRHFRIHWKKYVFGQVVGVFLASYLVKRLRERNVIRKYCDLAKSYGEQKIGMLDRPKRLVVFLNGYASNLNAKSKFNKYVAPLLHLSGMDVTVVESQYRGHLKELMEYVDASVDGIVVAGGDGTVLEVLNGLSLRKDAEKVKAIPVGLLPLGKENNSFTRFFSSLSHQHTARMFGEAAMTIIRGPTRQVSTILLQPEQGKALCAVSSVEWGVFKDGWRNRDRFKLFGKLRLLMSHISTALRHWPENCGFSMCLRCRSAVKTTNLEDPTLPMIGQRVPLNSTDTVGESMDWATVVKKADLPGWTKQQLNLVGLRVLPSTNSLSVCFWPESSVTQAAFINKGWQKTVHGGEVNECDGTVEDVEEAVMVPEFPGGWLSVDGEEYEFLAMTITLKHNALTLFSE